MEKLPRVRKTDAEKKEKKKGSRKKYESSQHIIRMGKDAFDRWQEAKLKESVKTNHEMVIFLLDLWDASKIREEVSHKTPMKKTGVLQSTPVAGPSEPPELKMSDISASEKSESESSEGNGLIEKYVERAKVTSGSFIEISFLEETPTKKETCYQPTFSEEEEAYDEDYDSYTDEDTDDDYLQTFDMSIRQDIDEDVGDLEVITSGEAIFNVDDDQSGDQTDTDIDTDSEETETRDLVRENKAICFTQELIDLAKMKITSTCTRKGCTGEVKPTSKLIGSSAKITWKCCNDHIIKTWRSQPKIRRRLAGDFLLSCGILSSGNNFEKIRLLFRFLSIGIVSKTTHYQIQSKHCVPVIKESFERMVEENAEKYRGKEITVAGDGRMDSPGYCAQYCTYTLLEYESKDIVACVVINKRETDMKSTAMEKEGLKRALQQLNMNGVIVKEVCTDASSSVAAFIAQEHKGVTHSFDTWHGAKNFGKKLGSVAAEKKHKELRPWVADVINHFWYCCRNASGSEDMLLAKWRGLLHHVVNIHEWALGDGVCEARCGHGDLEEGHKEWLEPGEDAHMALTRLVLDNRFLHTLSRYVNFRHTGDLETFHDHILMYCAKRFAYTYPVYKARNYMACIDYQHHKGRENLTSRKGEQRLHRSYSKRNNNWTSHVEKVPKDYNYIPELLNAMLNHFKESDEKLTSPVVLTPSDPRKQKRTLSTVSPPPTKSLFEAKKSRFVEDSEKQKDVSY